MVRPTSETIVNTYFAKWIQSYRDLPLLINQWANVVRWELRPRIFLRTTEFLWQEGHTCHATQEDATAYAAKILYDVYADFMVNVLAIPVLPGRKTARERFPGAINTLTVEAMMGDGKALQMGTSHELGQNFAKVFETQYSSESGSLEYVWQTSWGSSTRMVGGLIMCHGDDAGCVFPLVSLPSRSWCCSSAAKTARVRPLNDSPASLKASTCAPRSTPAPTCRSVAGSWTGS